jgi:DNA repair protein RadC
VFEDYSRLQLPRILEKRFTAKVIASPWPLQIPPGAINMSISQVADASPEQWPMQRSLTEPSSMAITEIIQQICSIDLTKAQHVVNQVCQFSNSTRFKEMNANELQCAGLTQKQAARLLAALEFGKRALTIQPRIETLSDPQSAAAALQYDLGFSAVEKVALLILDIQHRLISKEIIAVGSYQECIVDAKIVFERILRNQGSRFILAHNHPSGSSEPSPQDIKLTEDMLKASQLMNIKLLDHLVIIQGDYCSIREMNPYLWAEYED